MSAEWLMAGLRVYVMQLRQKIEHDPTRPRLLISEPGVGYRFKAE
jgi:two-component system, OmpR family, KDP operon response regulator KdpE